MEKIIIRNAELEDFEEIHKLIMKVHTLHVNARNDIYKNVDPLTIEEFKSDMQNDQNIYLVATLKSKVIGICLSTIKEISNNKIMKDRKILHIEDICVDTSKRNNGIGTKLYNALIKKAKETDVDSIELVVWSFNKNAIKFYEKLGLNVKNFRFEQIL